MHASYFCCAGCAAPSTDLLVISFRSVRSCTFVFFVLSDDVVSHGGSLKPAKNATFLNTREARCEPQFLSGVSACASAELRGPAWLLKLIDKLILRILSFNTFKNVIVTVLC